MPVQEKRKLAAILIADVVGFTAIMEADEAGTLARLRADRTEIVEPAIAGHGGRLVKVIGDGFLAEFGSAVDAVRCSLALQQAVAEAGRGLVWRVGINLGDVVDEDGDLYGDGVNLAARLQGLAPPGGIAIAGNVHEQIAGRVDTPFADLGEQRIRNLARPVRVWQWHPAGGAVDVPEPRRGNAGRKPTIVVLPFAGAAGDEEAEALAAGLADDLTTALAGRTGVEVVGRRAAGNLAALAGDVAALRQATGAGYLLTGALRRRGDRLRVTAELVETGSGAQVWSNRYDREWGDVFALEDELTERIAWAARWAINAFDGRRYGDSPDDGLDNAARRAKAAGHFYRFTPEDFTVAERLLDAALADDPGDAMAVAMMAFCLAFQGLFDVRRHDPAVARRALELSERAVALDRTSDYAFETRGLVALHVKGDVQAAIADARRSLALSPQYALANQLLAEALIYDGRPEEGIALLRKLIDLDPRDPMNYPRHWYIAMALFATADYPAALQAIEEARQGAMALPEQELAQAAILSFLGRREEARAIVASILERWPDARLATIHPPLYRQPEPRERYLAALREAGLPD